jgi:hypothetical protein
MERMGSAGIRAQKACRPTRLFAGLFVGLETSERTSENRGVPGSSPGLAIDRSPMITRFAAIRLWSSGGECGPDLGDELATVAFSPDPSVAGTCGHGQPARRSRPRDHENHPWCHACDRPIVERRALPPSRGSGSGDDALVLRPHVVRCERLGLDQPDARLPGESEATVHRVIPLFVRMESGRRGGSGSSSKELPAAPIGPFVNRK